jgi:hypothetical protein
MILLLVFGCCLPQEGRSRDVHPTDRTIEILVPVAEETKHASTVITFPEESLEALIAGWDENDLSLERRRDRLFVKLLRRAEGNLDVLGASGTLYRLYLRPSDGPFDGHVLILGVRKEKTEIDSLELIRQMRLGQTPEWCHTRKASGILYRNETMVLSARYIYETEFHRGFVIVLENISEESLRLDLSRICGEGLDLVGSKDLVMDAKGRTILYLVFWR